MFSPHNNYEAKDKKLCPKRERYLRWRILKAGTHLKEGCPAFWVNIRFSHQFEVSGLLFLRCKGTTIILNLQENARKIKAKKKKRSRETVQNAFSCLMNSRWLLNTALFYNGLRPPQADLNDELTMPVELRRAHQDNDRAVMAAHAAICNKPATRWWGNP